MATRHNKRATTYLEPNLFLQHLQAREMQQTSITSPKLAPIPARNQGAHWQAITTKKVNIILCQKNRPTLFPFFGLPIMCGTKFALTWLLILGGPGVGGGSDRGGSGGGIGGDHDGSGGGIGGDHDGSGGGAHWAGHPYH